MASPIISVCNLNYYYPDKKALENITFSIEPGHITALVGPNGAGKSTLMRCLAGLDTPFSGQIHINGTDALESPREIHKEIGYLSDDFGLYDELSVADVLTYIAGCHGITDQSKIDAVVQRIRIGDILKQNCGTLSRGWRQRVGIALSILHTPRILILDEPASGLDPEARSELSHILKTLQKDGMSILVSSHILSELEEYSTAMLVLRDGQIKEHITLEGHLASIQKCCISIGLASPLQQGAEDRVKSLTGISHLTIGADRSTLTIETVPDKKTQADILKTLIAEGLEVHSYRSEDASLQNLYLEIASHPDQTR